ncbi:hypothetical protein BD410DRAFT_769425 [Rickenella mellea]|uniref:Nab2 type CCCH zinc finger 4 domain-containing protein n=1 Tax=Rickenella mellea TaxID=50990 RepID=A0A4Y7Q720_9AGAM|nr:hypothetical protein BD410DRAFT_769425 [Rickenella mellea]
MPFDIAIGTERAKALQDSIQQELVQRGYSADADPVMAEYITIMLINNKTPDQITTELEDLIGASEYDHSFTDWLFIEAANKAQEQPSSTAESSTSPSQSEPPAAAARDPPPHVARSGSGVYKQAISQVLPTTSSQQSQKRTASARSPSPNEKGQGASKRGRTDLPTGPRAMQHRDGPNSTAVQGGPGPGRSLLERVGGRRHNGGIVHGRDEIQARIDAVTHGQDLGAMQMNAMNGMGMGGMMPGMGGPMGMAPGMMGMGGGDGVNPLALQDMMMTQMALMAQMANSMGILNSQGQFQGPQGAGFGNMNGGFEGQGMGMGHQGQGGPPRRGGGPPTRGRGRGGSAQWVAPRSNDANGNNQHSTSNSNLPSESTSSPPKIASSSSQTSTATPATPAAQSPLSHTPPERPQSPTLCKFGLKCTNALCRWSHPSPVATAESGVVLSNEPCEAGKNCKDKDCIKAHVSPAVANPALHTAPHTAHKPDPSQSKIPCRYGLACTRISSGCPFTHPSHSSSSTPNGSGTPNSHFNQQCRFGAGCTRAACPFQHPPGRVLPSTFHRGLSATAPVVSVPTPEAGSMGTNTSVHRSVVFNRPAPKDAKSEKKKDEERKEAAEVEASVVPKETKIVEATA